jgi:hypothetical protein
MRSAEKTFTTEDLFIDPLQAQFMPKHHQSRTGASHDGPVIILLDAHRSYTTVGLIAYAGSQNSTARLVAHQSALRLGCLQCIQDAA